MPNKREQIAGALKNMGYRASEANAAAAKLTDTGRSLDALLRDALRYVSGEEPKKSAASNAKGARAGAFARVRAQWRSLSPETRRGAVYVSGGLLVGGTLAILAGRAARALASEPTAAPAPPSPAKATAHTGATLVVATPGGAKQPGVLRASAGPQGRQLDILQNGTPVQVLDSAQVGSARWYHVQPPAPHPMGWMHSAILRGA